MKAHSLVFSFPSPIIYYSLQSSSPLRILSDSLSKVATPVQSGDKLIPLNGNSCGVKRKERNRSGRLYVVKGKREETHTGALCADIVGAIPFLPSWLPHQDHPSSSSHRAREREEQSRVHLLDTEPDLKTDENKAGAPRFLLAVAYRGWKTSVSGTRRSHICTSLNTALDYSPPHPVHVMNFSLQGVVNELHARFVSFHLSILEATFRVTKVARDEGEIAH